MTSPALHFDRFRFNPAQQRLEDVAGSIHLNPKSFAVLGMLLARRGELVLKDELLDTVWPDTHVADGVLKVCVAEIRRALGDSPTEPRFIETVHRRGYRFIATATAAESEAPAPEARSILAWPPGGTPTSRTPVGLVGRSGDLRILEQRFATCLAGERQLVFVSGEPGAGKTALVEHFAAGLAERGPVAITGSQCLEQFGAGEAYMPVLEAVGRLVRTDRTARLLLRRYAPTWFVQLPWLIDDEDRDRLGRELFGAARERMLRELAEFLEALAADIPLVVVLEDLHWGDPSTVDLLSLVAARREPARLLLIVTYRPVELILNRHPLRGVAQQLAAAAHCANAALDELDVGAVSAWVERRFARHRFASDVPLLLHARTDGNPLFLVTLVDHLLARGTIVEREGCWEASDGLDRELRTVPESARLLIAQQLDRLQPEDRRLLEAASLAGVAFSAATVAAALDQRDGGAAHIETRCEQLAGAGPFLRGNGDVTWPDGTIAEGFAFRHSLYRETLAALVPAGRRAELHRRIGSVLEDAYGARAPELAAELALHFEEAGDGLRAARNRRLAADTAARRHAAAEVEGHLEKALALLASLAPSPERDAEEMRAQSMLGAALTMTRGFAGPEVEAAYRRALELASAAPPERSMFPLLWGLMGFYIMRGNLTEACELADRMLVIADGSGDALMRMVAHHAKWTVHFFSGDFRATQRHLDEGEPLYDLVTDRNAALAFGQDQKVAALAHRAILEWYLGRIDQAVETSRRAVEHSHAVGHPIPIAFALLYDCWLRILRREPAACLETAEAVITYASDNGMPHWLPGAIHVRGWALAQLGEVERGMADIESALAVLTAVGANLGRGPRTFDLATLKAQLGRLDEARAILEDAKAVAARTGERYDDSEMLTFDAQLSLLEAGGAAAAPPAVREQAEATMQAAIDCAHRQGAIMLELRAVMALVKTFPERPSGGRARRRLAELLDALTEGFDTADLREASRLAGR